MLASHAYYHYTCHGYCHSHVTHVMLTLADPGTLCLHLHACGDHCDARGGVLGADEGEGVAGDDVQPFGRSDAALYRFGTAAGGAGRAMRWGWAWSLRQCCMQSRSGSQEYCKNGASHAHANLPCATSMVRCMQAMHHHACARLHLE